MRLKRQVPLLESSLKHTLTRPLLCSRCNRRRYASSTAYPEQVAILGGGVSGLTSAYYVSKVFPNSKITIYEAKDELGGWIKSKRVNAEGGDVLFEHGPRTLRPNASARPTWALIQDLNLVDDLLFTSQDSPAATNRYIYYPDRLNRLPNPRDSSKILSVWNCVRSGLFDGVWSLLTEAFKPKRPSHLTDESCGSFIARRTDKRVASNLASAILHGIYAGDVWQLSAKTLFPLQWQLEGLHGSLIGSYFTINSNDPRNEPLTLMHPYDTDIWHQMQIELKVDDSLERKFLGASTFSFKNGLQALMKRLEEVVKADAQVEVKTGTAILELKKVPQSERVEVVTGEASERTSNPSAVRPLDYLNTEKVDNAANKSESKIFDLVISTLPQPSMTPTVTVQVANLYFKTPNLIPQKGFGYLIPESVPFEQNPERALGVIFDSDAIQGQDSAPGTKLTVMMGGRWWDGWEGYPDAEEGAENAKSVLRRHLGITEEPELVNITMNYNCIPQYTVGYEDRLKAFANALSTRFHGKVRVVGNQFNGVGVNDCIRSAWLLARGLKDNGWRSRSVGLDRVLDERPWTVEPMLRLRKPS